MMHKPGGKPEMILGLLVHVLILALLIGWALGIHHAFRDHGTVGGILAIGLPPVGLYRAWEANSHKRSPAAVVPVRSERGQGPSISSFEEGGWTPVVQGEAEIIHIDTLHWAREPTGSVYQVWMWAKKLGELPVINGEAITDAYSATRFDCDGRRLQIMVARLTNGERVVSQTFYTPDNSPWRTVGTGQQVDGLLLDAVCSFARRIPG